RTNTARPQSSTLSLHDALPISPVLPEAKPPPFGKGGFEVHIHCHRSNDTGRVREVTNTDQPGAHCPRALPARLLCQRELARRRRDRKSTRLNSSHVSISYAVFC